MDLDLESIEDHLANHYNYDSIGDGKESFPQGTLAPESDRNDDEDGGEGGGTIAVVDEDSDGSPILDNTISSNFVVLEQVNHDPTSFT